MRTALSGMIVRVFIISLALAACSGAPDRRLGTTEDADQSAAGDHSPDSSAPDVVSAKEPDSATPEVAMSPDPRDAASPDAAPAPVADAAAPDRPADAGGADRATVPDGGGDIRLAQDGPRADVGANYCSTKEMNVSSGEFCSLYLKLCSKLNGSLLTDDRHCNDHYSYVIYPTNQTQAEKDCRATHLCAALAAPAGSKTQIDECHAAIDKTVVNNKIAPPTVCK